MSNPERLETLAGRPSADDWLARRRFQRLAVAVRLLSGARSEEEVVDIVRRSARVLSGAMGVAVVLRDQQQCHYVAEDSATPLWQGQRFAMGECISGWAMLNGQQAVISDIFLDDRIPHEAYRPTGVKSLVMTPVGEPQPFAALGAYWDEVREHREDEIAVLDALAHCMATALQTIELTESLRREARRADEHLGQAENRLRQREAAEAQVRFQAGLLDAVEQAVIATDVEGRVLYWNRFAETLYGWPAAEAIGRPVIELNAAPESEAEAQAIMATLKTGASWTGELVLGRRDGSRFPAYVTASPIRDAAGVLVGIVGISRDISDLREADRHQKLLINELNHRVRNTLAIVQSIAHQSLRRARSTAEAKVAFEARLDALAGAHVLMTDSGWRAVDLRPLLSRAIDPFAAHQFDLDGPPVQLASKTAVLFSLAVHELCTNAAKYGALSVETGRVRIRWSVAGEGVAAKLELDWTESGGPPVLPPATRGFGSRLIERGLAVELQGSVQLTFAPEGVTCRLEAPLPDAAPVFEGDPLSLFPLPA